MTNAFSSLSFFNGRFNQAAPQPAKRKPGRPKGSGKKTTKQKDAEVKHKRSSNESSSDTSDSDGEELAPPSSDTEESDEELDLETMMKRSVSENTLRTYRSHRTSLIYFGFEYTVSGLLKFMRSRRRACLEISNKTVKYWVSAFKFFLACESHRLLTPLEDMFLTKCQSARRRDHPDMERVTGAINKARTAEFIEWMNTTGPDGSVNSAAALSADERSLFTDVATALFGCALRVFQARTLGRDSFTERKDADGRRKEFVVRVLAKGSEKRMSNGESPMEEKPVHPEFVERMQAIIQRRSRNTELFVDFDKAAEAKFSACVKECAKYALWPTDQRFSGTHCFRHGAAQDAFIAGGLELAMIRTGHLSQESARRYALSDMEKSKIVALRKKPAERMRLLNKSVDAMRKRVNDIFDVARPPAQASATTHASATTEATATPQRETVLIATIARLMAELAQLAAQRATMAAQHVQLQPVSERDAAIAAAQAHYLAARPIPDGSERDTSIRAGFAYEAAQLAARATAAAARAAASALPLRRQRD